MRPFAGIELHGHDIPDESTILHFLHLLGADTLYPSARSECDSPEQRMNSPASFHLGCFTDVNRCSHKVYARPIAIPMSTRLTISLKLLRMDVSPQRANGP
jgi:hypothetical protein